ncbi:MAG: autotransporter assembly complex family protein [Gammaproteobacteria bacterium]
MLAETHRQLRCCVLLATAAALGGCGALPRAPWQDSTDTPEELPRVAADVTGVDSAVAANVRAHLALLREPCTAPAARHERIAADAEAETRRALRAQGYYEPVVDAQLLRDADTCPRLEVTIQPGDRVQLDDVEATVRGPGRADPAFTAFIDGLELKAGTPLDHGLYDTTRARIDTWAADHGYFDGRFLTRELRVQPTQRRASARLVYDSSARYGFGDLTITQTPFALDEDVVRRFFDFAPGEHYTSTRIAEIHAALRASDYFERSDIRPRIGARADGRVPLDVSLAPRRRHAFSTGVGFSTDEALRARFEYLDRRVNARGHRFIAAARASAIAQQFSTEYRLPRARPRSEWLSVQAGVRRESVDTFDTLEAQATLSETHERPYGFVETRFVELNRQSFDIATQDGTGLFLTPGLRYAKIRQDHALYPRRGYRVRAEIRAASETLASDTSLVRAVIAGGYLTTLPWQDRLLLRAEVGGLWAADFARLTPSLRFLTGGDASVRGYGYQDLGPVDARGNVVGGRYLGVASVEYEHALTGHWGLAGFVDAGNAFGGTGRDTGLKTGVGVGVRWRSPIGPIRVDLAHPLDDAAQVRLHLRVGPDL